MRVSSRCTTVLQPYLCLSIDICRRTAVEPAASGPGGDSYLGVQHGLHLGPARCLLLHGKQGIGRRLLGTKACSSVELGTWRLVLVISDSGCYMSMRL